MHADEAILNERSRQVIGGAFTVLNTLGAGFLEKVHENALTLELQAAGLRVEQQHGLTVTYCGQTIGQYFIALLVELKAVQAFDEHIARKV